MFHGCDFGGFDAQSNKRGETTLIDLVAGSLTRHADRIAVRDRQQHLTYRTLSELSNGLAHRLIDSGVKSGDRVGIAMARTVDLAVALLATLKAGAAAVCIDLSYPEARRQFMLEASGAECVITEPELVDGLRAAGLTVVTVPETEPRTDPPDVDLAPDMMASLLFTSGSTGTSKAVVLEHRNIAFFAVNPSLPQLQPSDCVGQISSISFDAFHFEFWSCLAAGGEVVFLESLPTSLDDGLASLIEIQGITAMLIPTMAFDHTVREAPGTLAGLRLLCVGGDVLSPSACGMLFNAGFTGELYNLYGPTETTTACTAYRVAPKDAQQPAIPLGRPLAGVEIRVVDDDLQALPLGVEGEIIIEGRGVAREYFGRPDLTAAAFFEDESQGKTVRAYRTGDRGSWRADGMLEFAGRADNQVKIRGYRVELAEVEAAIAARPGVDDAVVVPMSEGADRHLVAITTGGADAADVLADCRASLPSYFVPARIVKLDRLPITAHGKRDRKALAGLIKSQEVDAVEPAATSDTEQYLIQVWQDLLAVPQVERGDDFYALGGHSMLAFRLHRRVTNDRHIAITLGELMANSMLAGQAAAIDTAAASSR